MTLFERLGILVVVALLSGGGGYLWGSGVAEAQLQAAAARGALKASEQARAAEALADGAVANYVREHFDQEARYAQLQERNRHLVSKGVGLTVPSPVTAAPCVPDQRPVQPSAPTVVVVPTPVDDDDLTHRAVWMWNSALAGVDVPSGACGLAGGAAGPGAAKACAEPAGVALEDAWANHAINAKACAADRARYRQLIQLLRERQLVDQEPQ